MQEHKIIIYVGDNTEYLSDLAGDNSQLIDSRNYHKFLQILQPGIYHTSHADAGKITSDSAPLYEILKVADEINYCPPSKWLDQTSEFEWINTQYLTEYFLTLINNEKNNVNGLSDSSLIFDKYLKLENTRRNNDPCIFVTGCSISYGVGVNKNQTFGHLVSKKTNKELIMLAKPGSGLEFQKDQILRSGVCSGDIVIWGLTNEFRSTEWIGSHPRTEEWNKQSFRETVVYRAVTSIFQVINFCKKSKAQLILLPLICTESLRLGLSHIPEYIQAPYQTKNIDLGTDNEHPGPQQHKSWADMILTRLEENK